MNILVDLDSHVLSVSDSSPVRGGVQSGIVQFVRRGVPQRLPSGTEMILGIKSWDNPADVLLASATLTRPPADGSPYTFSLSLNTPELLAKFTAGVTLFDTSIEVKWETTPGSGAYFKTVRKKYRVDADTIRDSDAVPAVPALYRGHFYVSNGTGLHVNVDAGTIAGTSVAAQTAIVLTNNATNYVGISTAGVVSVSTSAFADGEAPLAAVTTVSGAITANDDRRQFVDLLGGGGGGEISNPSVAFCRTDGSDSTGDGSAAKPFRSLQHAVTAGFSVFDLGFGSFGDLAFSANPVLYIRGVGPGTVLGTLTCDDASVTAISITDTVGRSFTLASVNTQHSNLTQSASVTMTGVHVLNDITASGLDATGLGQTGVNAGDIYLSNCTVDGTVYGNGGAGGPGDGGTTSGDGGNASNSVQILGTCRIFSVLANAGAPGTNGGAGPGADGASVVTYRADGGAVISTSSVSGTTQDYTGVADNNVFYATSFSATSFIGSLSGNASSASTASTLSTTLAVNKGGTGITSFGTGVATALGQNVIGSGGITLQTGPTFLGNTSLGQSGSSGVLRILGSTSGTISITGAAAGAFGTYTMRLPTAVGTANQVLVCDGSSPAQLSFSSTTAITAVGTIGTGTWNGSVISQTYVGALTGDVTKPSGSGVTTLASIPAISGANLTTLNATNISSGTLSDARNTVSNSTTTSLTAVTTLGATAVVTNMPGTTSAASAITGTLTIGNGTAATNVGIGGGKVNIGGTLAAAGAVTFTANTASTSSTTGTLVVTGGIGASGNINSGNHLAAGSAGAFYINPDTSYATFKVAMGSTGLYMGSEYNLRWSNTTSSGSSTIDTFVSRKSAGIIRFGTTINASDGSIECTTVTALGCVKTISTTVAGLPAAATAGSGARAFVTDATATTFLSTVAGSGANKVPVVSDGTNWLIG